MPVPYARKGAAWPSKGPCYWHAEAWRPHAMPKRLCSLHALTWSPYGPLDFVSSWEDSFGLKSKEEDRSQGICIWNFNGGKIKSSLYFQHFSWAGTSADRNMSRTNKDSHDPLQVTIEPITRGHAKRLKEALAELIQEVQLKEDSKLTINEE